MSLWPLVWLTLGVGMFTLAYRLFNSYTAELKARIVSLEVGLKSCNEAREIEWADRAELEGQLKLHIGMRLKEIEDAKLKRTLDEIQHPAPPRVDTDPPADWMQGDGNDEQ